MIQSHCCFLLQKALKTRLFYETVEEIWLSTEIGLDDYSKVSNLGNFVDYSSFDGAISKMIGEDETSWGLSEQEIRDIKPIFDISHYESSVTSQLFLKLFLNGNTLTTDVIEAKINNLYLALA